MNKKEVIEKIENIKGLAVSDKTIDYREVMVPIGEVLNIINQLDEPEKPVLSKDEDEWLEKLKRKSWLTKYDLLYYITRQGFGHGFVFESFQDSEIKLEVPDAKSTKNDEIKERLVNAVLFGYEVEKEKLYTVELPNPNDTGHVVLYKDKNDKITIEWDYAEDWKRFEGVKLTESEIKKDFEWAWQFAEEVEE